MSDFMSALLALASVLTLSHPYSLSWEQPEKQHWSFSAEFRDDNKERADLCARKRKLLVSLKKALVQRAASSNGDNAITRSGHAVTTSMFGDNNNEPSSNSKRSRDGCSGAGGGGVVVDAFDSHAYASKMTTAESIRGRTVTTKSVVM
jgi:hypothetical protein